MFSHAVDPRTDKNSARSFDANRSVSFQSLSSVSEGSFPVRNQTESKLSVFYTNADNVMNKRDELKIEVQRYNPDIIVVTELFPKTGKSTDIFISEMKIQGYGIVTSNVKVKSRGVCIMVRDSISYCECNQLTNTPFEEACFCVITLESNEKLLLGGIYHSPSSTQANTKLLFELINSAVNLKYDYTVFVGDFNFPDISWEDWTTPHNEDHPEFYFLECLRDNFLSQSITENTRYRDGQSPHILDLLLVDKSEIVDNINYSVNLGASDHVCFVADLLCCPSRDEVKTERRNFYRADYDVIRQDLEQADWNCMEQMNVKDSWDYFLQKVNDTVEKNVPIKIVRNNKRKKQKWMDNETFKYVKRKHKTWNRYIHTLDAYDYAAYLKARNECTENTRKAKRKYEKSIADDIKTNPKGFWSYVREKTKCKLGIADLKDTNGDLVQDSELKADLLNDFFASVFVQEDPGPLPLFDIRYQGTPVTELVVNTEIVFKQMQQLNSSKSMGSDNCHPHFLKETADVLSSPLQSIFNKSFEEGTVPDLWKEANITPLYKNKGAKSDTTNYRPVSLTSVPCKLCEKTVRKTIMDHMNDQNLFSTCQYGFRNKRNCVLQLLDVLDDWVTNFDKSEQTDVVYLDIKKAFDTVPHRRLIEKMQGYGFGGKLIEWVKNFLKDRRQRVCIDGKYSSWKNITSGIPQGSVLGPTLFILYVNDMPDKLKAMCKLFADDCKIYSAITARRDQDVIQEDLDTLGEWSKDWLLEFSVPKCKAMQIGNIKFPHTYSMTDKHGQVKDLPNVQEEKDLGITFQSNLKFNKHVSQIVNRANRLLGMIKRTFPRIEKETFIALYKSLVRSILDYGGSVWSPGTWSKKNLRMVENVQRRATKLVPALRNLSYRERLEHLNLPTLNYRRNRYDLITLFKIIHGFEDIDYRKFFEFKIGKTRGHRFKIDKKGCNKSKKLNSFPARCINAWNDLNDSTVCCDTIVSFKSKLDKEWRLERFNVNIIYQPGSLIETRIGGVNKS